MLVAAAAVNKLNKQSHSDGCHMKIEHETGFGESEDLHYNLFSHFTDYLCNFLISLHSECVCVCVSVHLSYQMCVVDFVNVNFFVCVCDNSNSPSHETFTKLCVF